MLSNIKKIPQRTRDQSPLPVLPATVLPLIHFCCLSSVLEASLCCFKLKWSNDMNEHFNTLKMTSCDLLCGHNLFFISFLD